MIGYHPLMKCLIAPTRRIFWKQYVCAIPNIAEAISARIISGWPVLIGDDVSREVDA